MADHQAHILQAKVEVLESVVVFLAMRETLREPDPVLAANNMAANFRIRVEEQARNLAKTPEVAAAQVIALEVLDSFFDRVKSAVQKNPDPQ